MGRHGVLVLAVLSAGCDDTTAPASGDDAALSARIAELEAALAAEAEARAALEDRLAALEAAPPSDYTDEMAVAAVQNDDPWGSPDRANLQNLWSQGPRGYHWLDQARWTMDNRTNPPATGDRHELVQMFHETVECVDGDAFNDCNSTSALKFYVNGPRITDNDWSAAGYAAAAVRTHHTHASGIYLVSFGQSFVPVDYGYAVIPPSGIHLEPHGAHQALRIDGVANAGENIRVDVAQGATGLSIYSIPAEALYCDDLGRTCEETYPLWLRGGRLHLEDLQIERSAVDARGTGPAMLHDTSLGIEHFYTWHVDPALGVPVHCTWSSAARADSMVAITPYSTSPDLLEAHSYAIVDVWGPGEAPATCTGTQLIKTDAAGVYGYTYASTLTAEGGFSVAILGTSGPLAPEDWGEAQRPAFRYEIIDPI